MTVHRASLLLPDVTAGKGTEIDSPPGATGGLSAEAARRLRQVLLARYGADLGIEAWNDTVAYAWEHAASLRAMTNPVGYLYRVAQTSVRRQQRWRRTIVMPSAPPDRLPEVEPALPAALAALSAQQRLAVLLVHAHGWTHAEAAAVLEIDVSTLRNHLRRGLRKLRTTLGVED